MTIRTERLELIPGTRLLLEAELAGPGALQDRLGVAVPESWPPPLYDAPAVEWTLERVREDPEHENWGFRYFVLVDRNERSASIAVGAGGYKGPPKNGAVEIGYSVLPEYQRRGIATEAAAALVAQAFSDSRVTMVTAETLPDLIPSIGVLEKLGFRLTGAGSEDGVIRYGVNRDTFTGAARR